MGDELSTEAVMVAPSIGHGTHPSMVMQGNHALDPFKSYAVELRNKKHDNNLLEIVESSLKRYDSDEVDAFVEGIIKEVSSYYPDQTTEIKRNEKEMKEADEPLVPDENVMLHIGARYNYMGMLGSGASCRVLKVRDLESKMIYAVKEMLRSKPLNGLLFAREVRLLKMWDHPNILRFFDCYVDKKCYYIATEYCSGGTLLDRMKRERRLSEDTARGYVSSILSAIEYIHSQNIVHRDLKAKNVVFTDPTEDGVLKVIDFGDAKQIKEHEVYTDFACTLHYMPPEILRPRTGKELKKGDLWTTGVMAYLMVCGRPPFTGKDRREIVMNITSETRKLRWPKDVNVSEAFREFIGGLLTGNVKERMTATEALQHHWITGKIVEKPSLLNTLSAHSRSLSMWASQTFDLKNFELFEESLDLDGFDINEILDEAENDDFDPEEEEEPEDSDDEDDVVDKNVYEPYEPYKDRGVSYQIRLQSVAEEEDEESTMREIMGDTTEDALTPMDSPGLSDDLMVPAYHNTSHYSNTSGQSDDSVQTID